MSLPDTLFIFVLALIIFGPKKLPEIGRQLGKLVGEFRRASNEFKFQIEEELRQADLSDKGSGQQTIGSPSRAVSRAMETLNAPLFPAATNTADSLPVGQHPNIENLDQAQLETNAGGATAQSAENEEHGPDPASAIVQSSEKSLQVAPAVGSLARTTMPYAKVTNPVNDSGPGVSHREASDAIPSSLPANTDSSVAETEITHG